MPEFYENWYEPEIVGDSLNWNLNLSADKIESINPDKIWDYSVESVKILQKELGEKPALCLSGGIDSQVMVDCFIRADAIFDVVIMRFPENLNLHDIKTAIEFCDSRQLKYKFIDVDVISFLNRELLTFAGKYDVSSPQFATHFKMFEILQQQGYSSAVCGGNTLVNSSNGWTCPTTKEQNDWRDYSIRSKFYVMGDFLSYFWKFSLLLSCNLEKSFIADTKNLGVLSSLNNYDDMLLEKYKIKTAGYRSAGFDIIPQETKLTGFERVKEEYKKQNDDGWAFEKNFRTPLTMINPGPKKSQLILDIKQNSALNALYDKCIFSRMSSACVTN